MEDTGNSPALPIPDVSSSNTMTVADRYEEILERFFQKITTLRDVLPVTIQAVTDRWEEAHSDLMEFVKSKCTILSENDGTYEFEVPITESKQYTALKISEEQFDRAADIINNSFIVTLVSQFDKYVSETITCMLESKPELLNDSGRSVMFSELSKYSTIAEYRRKIVEEEVDSVMRMSHVKQLDWMSKKINGSMKDDKVLVAKFVELTERRNLFVHTDGVISNQYITVCTQEGFGFKTPPVAGEQLLTTAQYFYSSVFILLEIAGKISSFVIKKVHEDLIDSGKSLLVRYIYDNLEYGNYFVVRNLVKYAKSYTKLERIDDMILSVNNILTYYLIDKDDEVDKLLKKMDWSDCSEKFKLAHAVLTKEWKAAALIMEKIGDTEEVPEIFYHQWPLFEKFRETDEFRQSYFKVFGRRFETTLAEPVQIEKEVSSGQ